MKLRFNTLSFFLVAAAFAQAADVNSPLIANTKHNLSISGPGEMRSASEADVCIFCHAPHSASSAGPLWNHQMSATTYTPYSSPTLKATVGQPTGSSRLCLSCHDGTVALGAITSQPQTIPMRKGTTTLPPGPSRIGAYLSAHHPISFVYDSSLAIAKGELRDPVTLKQEVHLDKNKELQCTACHDPHNNQYGKFLVKDNTASALCLECHTPSQWSSSAHATSTATWNGTGRNPWPHTTGATVAANGCENCHTPHTAGTRPALLTFEKPEDNCLVCHNGTVAAKNMASEFSKPSAHAASGLTSLPDITRSSSASTPSLEHVSCVDCHNPHVTRSSPTAQDSLSGPLAQVRGVTASGTVVTAASREYEICFRCHASSASTVASSRVPRQFSQPNARLQFSPANASYHPVVSAARSAVDSTLILPWTTASVLRCTDCHNNDQGPGAKGVGPNGPHGSLYSPLLERNLIQMDFQPESYQAYALCYKCHNENSVLSDSLHSKHVRNTSKPAACSTCHDAHGVQNQTHLINFNTIYVQPLNGRINYTDMGGGRGNCTLTCHDVPHNAKPY